MAMQTPDRVPGQVSLQYTAMPDRTLSTSYRGLVISTLESLREK